MENAGIKNIQKSCGTHGQSSLAGSTPGLSLAASTPGVLVKREEDSVSLGNSLENQLMPVKKMQKVEEGAEVKVEYEDNAEVKVMNEESGGSIDGDDCSANEELGMIEIEALQEMMESLTGKDLNGGQEKADQKIYCKGMDKKTYWRDYQQKNKEKRARLKKAWVEKNKEHVKKSKKAQYEKNKDKYKRCFKAYREKNRERNIQASKTWYSNNKKRAVQLNRLWRERKKREACTMDERIERLNSVKDRCVYQDLPSY